MNKSEVSKLSCHKEHKLFLTKTAWVTGLWPIHRASASTFHPTLLQTQVGDQNGREEGRKKIYLWGLAWNEMKWGCSKRWKSVPRGSRTPHNKSDLQGPDPCLPLPQVLWYWRTAGQAEYSGCISTISIISYIYGGFIIVILFLHNLSYLFILTSPIKLAFLSISQL